MADVYLCAHCGSTDLMANPHSFQCLHCGNLTNMRGGKLPVEPKFEGGFRPYHKGIGGQEDE